jgi:hypothetical protein
MNAALRIYPPLRSVLMRGAEILNAVFICRRKKGSPGGRAAPQTPGANVVPTAQAPSGRRQSSSPRQLREAQKKVFCFFSSEKKTFLTFFALPRE